MEVTLDRSTTSIRDVRDVAPNKHMGCATFVIPQATVAGEEPESEDQHTAKRSRVESS